MQTGFCYDKRFLEHNPGQGHPESKERLIASMEYFKNQPWFQTLKQISPKTIERTWVEHVHKPEYIEHAKSTCLSGAAFLDSMDVGISGDSFDVALLAAGATIELADEVVKGNIRNGFGLLRPPGHHAEHDMALGFCLFNNVAILARYLQKQHGVNKVLILDWDVHHGNGTQHTFEEDPSVLYISTHQYPYYPGTGAYTETGIGRGAGSVLNCPMSAGSGDEDYEQAFLNKIIPKIEEFKPEFIIISAGFDAHKDDPLAQISLNTNFFGWMTLRLMELADRFCNGRIISVLEGGYNLTTLPHCIEQHLVQLSQTT